jgi:hypothetical protein
MHRHLCSHCEAVITLDEGRNCLNKDDHADGFCEACALGQCDIEAGNLSFRGTGTQRDT